MSKPTWSKSATKKLNFCAYNHVSGPKNINIADSIDVGALSSMATDMKIEQQ